MLQMRLLTAIAAHSGPSRGATSRHTRATIASFQLSTLDDKTDRFALSDGGTLSVSTCARTTSRMSTLNSDHCHSLDRRIVDAEWAIWSAIDGLVDDPIYTRFKRVVDLTRTKGPVDVHRVNHGHVSGWARLKSRTTRSTRAIDTEDIKNGRSTRLERVFDRQ